MLTKNWLPPVFGDPVLAMDKVPGSLLVLSTSSSGMFPPFARVTTAPVGTTV